MPRLSATTLSIEQLERILNSRRTELRKLTKQRDRLARRLDAIDRRIRAFGGSAGAMNGKRARNAQSLTTVIESVLKNAGKPVPVGDIADAAVRRGYRSNSANFRGIVNQTLIKDKRFAQASRGVYQLKK